MLSGIRHGKPQQLLKNAQKGIVRSYAIAPQDAPQHISKAPHRAKKPSLDDWDKLGNTLIKTARYGEQQHQWKTSKRRQLYVKPEQMPVHPKRWKSPSFEKTKFSGKSETLSTVDEESVSSLSGENLETGSFVELRRGEVVRHGVILATKQAQIPLTTILCSTGEVLNILSSDIMFHIPKFIDADLLDRCGRQEIIDDKRMLTARQHALKLMREFERSVEHVHNRMALRAKGLYEVVRAADPEEWAEVSTIEASRHIHSPPNPPITTLFAVHKHLMRRSDEFVAQAVSHRQSHSFYVRPQSHLTNLQTVTHWLRENHPIFQLFCTKARRIIKRSRALAVESTGEPPSMMPSADEIFDANELEFVKLLQLSLNESRFTQVNPYAVAVPTIVKRIGLHNGDVDAGVVLDHLRDLGVHSPWEDIASKDREWNHIIGNRGTKTAGADKQDEGLLAVDPHESVRHDFGQMPVFVMDDASAEELDDGISFEAVPNDTSSGWVHVHIADPSALMSPTHPFAMQARRQMETVYFIHDTWPLFPHSIGRTGLRASAGDNGNPQNVLTFSIKLNNSGDILDYKIRPAVVRSVHVMTYDDVNATLGLEVVESTGAFDNPPKETQERDLTKTGLHVQDIRSLYTITEKLITARLKLPILSYTHPKPNITMVPKPLPTVPQDIKGPSFFRGFPEMTYTVVDSNRSQMGSRSVVAECMKLAGRVASRFCVENGISMFRRASRPLQFYDTADLDRALALRDERGCVSELEMGRFDFHAPPGEYTLEPKGHWALGIADGEGYVRATSPLRRFQDLVAHWQIKSALLPVSGQGARVSPFSDDELMKVMKETARHGRFYNRVKRHHERYWAHAYIARYLQSCGDDKNHLLQNLDAYAMNFGDKDIRHSLYHTDVTIPSLGLMGDLRTMKNPEFTYGTPLKVRVAKVERGLFPTLLLEFAG